MSMRDDEAQAGPDVYEPPTVTLVGSFAADTMGSYSVGQSDDGDAGAYYSPKHPSGLPA
jgi:hypothetical protein